MPELPEIETVKLQLQQVLVGLTINKVEVRSARTLQGKHELLEGKKVIGVRRRAKVLIIDLENNISMAFHFKMTGQLIYVFGDKRIAGGHPTEDFVNKLPGVHTRIVFELSQGNMYFNDQRLFGWVKVGTTTEIDAMDFIVKLGPEPFDIDAEEFIKRIGSSRRPIKVAIMDQEIISGVGNIYANDALWEAEINPATTVAKLSPVQLGLLFEKIILVLKEGIKYGGATADNYVNAHGIGGHYQEHFRTYNREGKPCLRCKTLIVKTVIGGRGTFYCPSCQQ